MENSLCRRVTALTVALGVPALVVLGGATGAAEPLSEMLKGLNGTVQQPDPQIYLAQNE